MITVKEWRSFPFDVKENIIKMVYGANIQCELDMIKNNILNFGEYESEIVKYISPVLCNNIVGNYYEVKSLVYVRNASNIEEDNS